MRIGKMSLTLKDVPKGVLYFLLLFAMGTLDFSWISVVVWGLLLFSSIAWAVSIKLRRCLCQRVFKYMLVGVMLFTILFAVSEAYLFRTVGQPPTFDPSQPGITVSCSTILNTSIGEVLYGIKNTPAFSLLSLEYPDENVLKYMELTTRAPGIDGGEILIRFHHSTTIDFSFRSYLGRPYEVSARPWTLVLPTYVQQQSVDEAIQQMDELGLQWFYDRTIEKYPSIMRPTPEITDIRVEISWDEYNTYQGLTLSMSLYENKEPRFSPITAVFQPDGTLLK
jgi:hypothetical protein